MYTHMSVNTGNTTFHRLGDEPADIFSARRS